MTLNKISSEGVKKATGKTWEQWLKLLDSAGCRAMSHKQIVAVVNGKFEIGPWWQQMVTVGYEQARGLRVKHQTVGGYSVNVNKTLAFDADQLFDAWTDAKQTKRWLDGSNFEITTSTRRRSIRMKWGDDDSRVNVMLYPKAAEKTQLSVEHGKLKSAAAVEKMRKFWKQKIEKLQTILT